MQNIHKTVEKVLYNRQEIENRIYELAQWVNKTYQNSENLILVGLMKGSMPFMMQLIKDVEIDCVLDFLTVSSYHGTTQSSGSAKIVLDMAQDIKGKDVLIVEEIVDTGLTLGRVTQLLSSRKPKSLKILTLLDKPSNRINEIRPNKIGFTIENHFVVGFGLDYNEKLRNLPYIGIFNKKFIDKV